MEKLKNEYEINGKIEYQKTFISSLNLFIQVDKIFEKR